MENKSEQQSRPPDEGFQMFSMEEWLQNSSTYKIFTGSFRSPLPPDLPLDSKNFRSVASAANEVSTTSSSRSKNTPAVLLNPSTYVNTEDGSGTSACPQRERTTEVSDLERNVLVLKKHLPGKRIKADFAKRSSLNADEQRDYLKYTLKFQHRKSSELSGIERVEFQHFQTLKSRVQCEQTEFSQLAFSDWPTYMCRATELTPALQKHIAGLWRRSVKRALFRYKHQYQKLCMVSLAPFETHVNLKFLKHLLEIGSIPLVQFPELGSCDTPFRTMSSPEKLRSWFLLNVKEEDTAGTLHKVPVSGDPNAERLARLHNANVVISSSGLKALMDNHQKHLQTVQPDLCRTWCLPIVVTEHHGFVNGKPTMKKIVFIDKALPKSQMTGADYVTSFLKYSTSAAMLKRESRGKDLEIAGAEFLFHSDKTSVQDGLSYEGQDHLSSPRPSHEPGPSSTTASHIGQPSSSAISPIGTARKLDETFESSLTHSPCGQKKLPTKSPCENTGLPAKETTSEVVVNSNSERSHGGDVDEGDGDDDDDDDDDDDKLKIDIEDEFSEPCKDIKSDQEIGVADTLKTDIEGGFLEPPKDIKSGQEIKLAPMDHLPSSSCSLDVHPQQAPESSEIPKPKVVHGHALPLNITNVNYNLWTLAPETPQSGVGGHSLRLVNKPGINVLVRCRVDGCEKKSKTFMPCSLSCKPEYQLEYAAQAMTLSELTREWAGLVVRPSNQLARVRVSTPEREVVMIERRNLTELAGEAQRLYQVRLEDRLATLYAVLSQLMDLPAGQFLLSYKPQDGAFATLLRVADSNGPVHFDLNREYNHGPGPFSCSVPWPPLDPNVILPRNEVYHTVPCTYLCDRGQKYKQLQRKRKPQVLNMQTASKKNKKKKKNRKNKKKNVVSEVGEESGNEMEVHNP